MCVHKIEKENLFGVFSFYLFESKSRDRSRSPLNIASQLPRYKKVVEDCTSFNRDLIIEEYITLGDSRDFYKKTLIFISNPWKAFETIRKDRKNT